MTTLRNIELILHCIMLAILIFCVVADRPIGFAAPIIYVIISILHNLTDRLIKK